MFLKRIKDIVINDNAYTIVNRLLFKNAGAASTSSTVPVDATANSTSIEHIIEKWHTKFENERVPEVKSSLENILAHVLNQDKLDFINPIKLTDTQIMKFEQLCECRIARMPIQYIIGEWDFRDITLQMQPPVFIPRPETEELVELILQQFDCKRTMRFLEIGCGTGAISLTLLKSLPKATCTAIDQSLIACELTMKNAATLKLENRLKILRHKLTETSDLNEIDGLLDLIVSNPPYVSTDELRDLQPEIQLYEDLRALDGGKDGMTVIKSIIKLASIKLREKGMLWLEIDPKQTELIVNHLNTHTELQLKFVASYKDMYQKERFVEIIKV